MSANHLQAGLLVLLGVTLVLVAVLVPDVREHQLSFGTLIGLGSSMISLVLKGPLADAEISRLKDELTRLRARFPSDPPPPPLGRR